MKNNIQNALANFSDGQLTENCFQLFQTLGYNFTDVAFEEKTPNYFYDTFVVETGAKFDKNKALFDEWLYCDLLFQISDKELQGLKTGKLDQQNIASFLFLTVELSHNTYTRSRLAGVAWEINRIFGMPIVLIFKYGEVISLAIVQRRINKTDAEKDVLEKITFIKDINCLQPHRAHIEILNDLSFQNLLGEGKQKITHFVELYNAWQKVLNTKELNKKFFKQIANWYFWATSHAKFPCEYLKNDSQNKDKSDKELQEIANQKAIIRFITRIVFVWFLKEKKLIPSHLFDKTHIQNLIKDFEPQNEEAHHYYNAILQNLFFATLNRPKNERDFAPDKGFLANIKNFDINSLYRNEKLFQDENTANIMQIFAKIPFLNGGLFDCLDRKTKDEDSKDIIENIDGFSRTKKKRAIMPDSLFFAEKVDFNAELNKIYDTKSAKYDLKGLFLIFEEYKFTVEENTPLETDVALDPYLLGEIFENLLAYYNPETGATARKGSGSFYTPQEIVNYMVEESLKAYMQPFQMDNLTDLNEREKQNFVKKLSEIKILDPACGSGAFPMGILYKMLEMLKSIDPNNSIWKETQKEKIIGDKIAELKADENAIAQLSDAQVRERAIKAVKDRIKEIEEIFNNEFNFDDYARKLFIIQNCIYGVDIQDVAIQISKLRFFLSLIIDQKNEDIQPLPNLETKFVVANTLIGVDLPKLTVMGKTDHSQDPTKPLKDELKTLRAKYFTLSKRSEKAKLKEEDKALRKKIADELMKIFAAKDLSEDIEKLQQEIENQKIRLEEAELLPDWEQEMIVKDLFGAQKTIKVNHRTVSVNECLLAIKTAQNLIKDMIDKQNNSEAGIIRQKVQKVANWDIYNPNAHADWFDSDWMFGVKEGFDVVIGNPPYVALQKMKGSEVFAKMNFKTYSKSSDLYCLFYEKAVDLLNQNGKLCFITSNSWLRTKYGQLLRSYFAEKTNPLLLMNFEDVQIFDSAVVESNILIAEKNTFQKNMKAVNVGSDFNFSMRLNDYLNKKGVVLNQLDDNGWVLGDTKTLELKAKIEMESVLLGRLKMDITYGIRSGLNEVFVINDELKDSLITKDSKNREIIKPILRGRDLSKFTFKFCNNWIILAKYKQNDLLLKNYPTVFEYLSQFETKLKNRGQVKANSHHWIELDNSPSEDYLSYFEKPKIIWIVLSDKGKFAYDDAGHYTNDSCFIMTGENLKYLLSILNSKLAEWYFNQIATSSGVGTNMWKKYKVEQFPIKVISSEKMKTFEAKVDAILLGKSVGDDTSLLESKLDVMVYHLYGLSYEEACVIEPGLSYARFV